MKTIIAYIPVLMLLLGISACSNDDLSTNQYSGGVSLNVFGPSPVVRGGTLRFFGSNLDQVNQVLFPGADAVTDIEVTQAGVPSEIRAKVPEAAQVGYVTLVTASGDSLKTTSQLTYIETITFTSFSPSSVMPGDVLTIEGDYLNYIQEVIFEDGVIVKAENFLSQERSKITVTVPNDARTGKITLSDGDSSDTENIANLIESESELEVKIVTTVTSITSDNNFKAGGTLTITGTYLHLVDYIQFAGTGTRIPSKAIATASTTRASETMSTAFFNVNDEGTQITLLQPYQAASGDISFTLSSGVEIPTAVKAESFVVATPTVSTLSSETDGGVKAGKVLTITGTALDMVNTVDIGDYKSIALNEESTEAELYVTVPGELETGDYSLVLNLTNGTTVSVDKTVTVRGSVYCKITDADENNSLEDKTYTSTSKELSFSITNESSLNKVTLGDVVISSFTATNGTLTFSVPDEITSGDLKLVLTSTDSGDEIEEEYTVGLVYIIWTGSVTMDKTDWSIYIGDLMNKTEYWTNVTVGQYIMLYYETLSSVDYSKIELDNSSWTILGDMNASGIELSSGTTEYSVEISEAMLTNLQSGGLIVKGYGVTVTGVGIK